MPSKLPPPQVVSRSVVSPRKYRRNPFSLAYHRRCSFLSVFPMANLHAASRTTVRELGSRFGLGIAGIVEFASELRTVYSS